MTECTLESGHFVLGCNYWASHAGTATWSNWRPEIMEKDLAALSKAGMHALRVFPLWSDFQPLSLLRTACGGEREYRFGENPLPDTEAGRAGVSEEMIRRFETFLQLAEKYNLKLIIGLVTGWMSGRLFVPPAFEGKNVLTDPAVLRWQVRFIQFFVRRFINAKPIMAWDLGNECNCMGTATHEQAWAWTFSITHAIRGIDGKRPVISGMHSLLPNPGATWSIQDQAELTDVLTTHPYPIFTPYCDHDPINSIRTILHGSAESRMYADVGHKPCFIEETGALGPMFAGDEGASGFLRAGLFSAWVHDCLGLFWWSAFEQNHLSLAPYDWCPMERELGLIMPDHTPKPVVKEYTKFRGFLDGLPTKTLPSRLTEAVCILTADQDQWGAAFGSFILAKQAGFDIEFQYEDQPLREAPIYMLPSICGHAAIHNHRWLELLDRVRNGATLYISFSDGFICSFPELTGWQNVTRQRRNESVSAAFHGLEGKPSLPISGPFRLNATAPKDEVLGAEADGNPVFSCHTFGKGKVFFLACPIETALVGRPGSFTAEPYWKIYRHLFQAVPSKRAVTRQSPSIGITEHPLDDRRRIVALINYQPTETTDQITLANNWTISKAYYGEMSIKNGNEATVKIPANEAVVVLIVKYLIT
jgi:hypothetical protein